MSLIAQKLISASGPKEATDADFPLVTGLYHFDSSNGAQNNTFLDSSDSGHTLTRNGNTTQGTFTLSVQTRVSGEFYLKKIIQIFYLLIMLILPLVQETIQ